MLTPARTISEELRDFWRQVDAGKKTNDDYESLQSDLITEYRAIWSDALCMPGSYDLVSSALHELADYSGTNDLEAVRKRCTTALDAFRDEWERKVNVGKADSIEKFYDENQSYLYELIWWHTLCDDESPLSYVSSLLVSKLQPGLRYLDFGSGVGSGALLFARHGFDCTIADISTPLLNFASWRLKKRGLNVPAINLNHERLPTNAFDMITAMDVFEHLTDPVATVRTLASALKPMGILLGRFHTEDDDDRDYHIVRDFEPTFRELEVLGFREIWKDDWLWGHQAFQRS